MRNESAEACRVADVVYGICRGLPSASGTCPTVYVNTHLSCLLTEEYPQRDAITSELGTYVLCQYAN